MYAWGRVHQPIVWNALGARGPGGRFPLLVTAPVLRFVG
jgi:hypothetical protein